MTVIGQQQHRGIPVDRPLIERFQAMRPALRERAIEEAQGAGRFFNSGRFSQRLFFEWIDDEEIGWPRTDTGRPVLRKDIFGRMAALEPRVAPLAELRSKLSKLESMTFPVRSDDRIRPDFYPFRTRTGRNGASASEYPMLESKWVRGFVLAPPGRALAQLDYKAEEVYIAGALSGDRQLLMDLEGDPYLGLAIRSGLAPEDATKATHGALRDRFKIALLGIVYGMGEWRLAQQLGVDVGRAREVLAQFRRRYRVLSEWLEDVVKVAYTSLHLETPLGWPLIVGPKLDSYTLRNHLIQATGGDVLRAACLYAQDEGLSTIATTHDSILLEADEDRIESDAATLADCMTRGAQAVIDVPIPAEIEFIGRRYRLMGQPAMLFAEVCDRIGGMSGMGSG
jgi:DNA polymerase I-like protein with 3'-5' exonuclease and polymerase domains